MFSETRYLAYLLRMWVTRRDGSFGYRIVLLNPHTDEEHVFADLESLIRHLRTAVETQPALPPD